MNWLPVSGWPYYEVNENGEVRSLDREFTDSVGRTFRRRGKALSPYVGGRYPTVHLTHQGRHGSKRVHVLVAEAFIGPRPEGLEVRHLDGNPMNNHVSNLKYGTTRENRLDRVRHGTDQKHRKTHCPQGHPYSAENTYRTTGGKRQCRACNREYARRYQQRRRSAGET